MTLQTPRHPFEQLAEELARRIRNGEWRSGQQLPGIRDFEQAYPYSRVTIHKALKRLRQQGYITITPRSGAYVQSNRVREWVGVLTGGLLPHGGRSSLAMVCQEMVCAHLHRCGYGIRSFTDDARAALGIPDALDEELRIHRLTALLTIQSNFAYRHLRSPRWKQDTVPHVDIGALPASHRVFVDHDAFFQRAIEHVRQRDSHAMIGLIETGSGMSCDELEARYGQRGVRALRQPLELPRSSAHESLGFEYAQRLFAGPRIADALVVPDAHIAKGIVQAALLQGLSLPRDLTLCVMMNQSSEVFIPAPVERFVVDLEELVARACDLLIELINDHDLPPRTVLIPPAFDDEPPQTTTPARTSLAWCRESLEL